MRLEGIEGIRRRIDIVKDEILKEKNKSKWDLFVSFLTALKTYSREGDSFAECKEKDKNLVGYNLNFLNEYLISLEKEPLTEKDVEEIYNFFGK